ncbi:sulfatase [uncultured Chitinophaga sp.]|uniref:sulfatase n=1 Tax=uncultured Chitinophaga sp. TaxID=339340 RepID=UPI0025D1EDD0|nr:sulfatase [uncultured Chitinophaga sp.]
MKTLRLLPLLLLFWANNAVAQKQPNIILFMVDDMGWQDCSVPFWKDTTAFNRRYRTPNMERLAREGMKFTNAYATPVCSPSRVSLMTGMNAARHRVTNWTLRKNATVDANDSLLVPPDWNVNGLSPVKGIEKSVYATPLPQLLKTAGYYTIHCGKAHFGAMETPAEDPLKTGFMINIAGHAAGGPGSYLGEKNYGNNGDGPTPPWGVPGLQPYHGKPVFLTEALTQEALSALEKPIASNQPFFLYMAHYAVHVPFAADERFIERYRKMGLPEPEAQYAAMVEGMDKSLGDLMDYLEQKNLVNNTVILFMSDNGGYCGSPRAGQAFTQNSPLRAGKGSVYEGGIREPMIVKWPGVVQPATVTSQYVIIEDFFPTILHMAGKKRLNTVQKVDGRDFTSLLKGNAVADTTRLLVWHFPNKWIGSDDQGINFRSAARKGNWKLVYDQKTGKKELYDLANDIGETKDVSADHPRVTNEMSKALARALRGYQAQMPAVKATAKAIPYPDEL